MVSFQCDGCADTVKKPKLDSHRQRCHAPFTCLDCSTTFHGQEYNCITEAQKYQGALYKEPKKGKGPESQMNGSASVAAPAPAAVAESSTSSTTSSIHPSRLQAIESGPSPQQSNGYGYSRGGRGGRGGFAARGGRGAFGGGSARIGATGENRLTPGNGMRSWGSTPVNGSPAPEAAAAAAAPVPEVAASTLVVEDGEKKKKKKKKGDKGGTGSKANSKRPKSEAGDETTVITTPAEQPSQKKRKRDPSPVTVTVTSPAPAPAATPESQPSEKTIKRLRKNMTKLDAGGMSLAAWLEKVGRGKKDEVIDREHVLKGLKVGQVDGKWVLEVSA